MILLITISMSQMETHSDSFPAWSGNQLFSSFRIVTELYSATSCDVINSYATLAHWDTAVILCLFQGKSKVVGSYQE